MIGDLIVGGIVVLAIAGSVAFMILQRRKGIGSCGCKCSGCKCCPGTIDIEDQDTK